MKKSLNGFTIIELSLSITFIALLSLAVMILINNAVSTYHRGLTLNKVNTTGTEIVNDIRTAIQASPATPITNSCAALSNKEAACNSDKGEELVVVKFEDTVTTNSGQSVGNVPVSGAFCTGKYSYIWNTGYFFTNEHKVGNGLDKNKATFTYLEKDTNKKNTLSNFKLLKIYDEYRDVCASVAYGVSSGAKFDVTSRHVINETPEDLLGHSNETANDNDNENRNLALYDLAVAMPADNSNGSSIFYSVSFILGTLQGGINIQSRGNYCATPEGFNSEMESFDYCAINKFNFAAQATTELNG